MIKGTKIVLLRYSFVSFAFNYLKFKMASFIDKDAAETGFEPELPKERRVLRARLRESQSKVAFNKSPSLVWVQILI